MRRIICTAALVALFFCGLSPFALAGVCCLPSGMCQVTTFDDCFNALGSFWEGGTSCDPDPCSALGACCVWDGSQGHPVCHETSGYECAIGSKGVPGTWGGPGTDCTPNPCLGEAPCCLPDNSCVVLDVFACEAQGGVSLGSDYVSCDPNPCPVPHGACCFEWGARCVETTEVDCSHREGPTFMGDGTTCDTIQCTNYTGACCLPDHSCFVAPEFVCQTAGGEYAGDGTVCIDSTCPPVATERVTWGRIKSRY